jgi:transcriptional regulator with XRE-family HTH domain
MAKINNEQLRFNSALCARVKHLRELKDWTSEEMATALGINPDAYRKYEYRTPIPHYLVERFALIVVRDVEYVLTGNIRRGNLAGLEKRGKLS